MVAEVSSFCRSGTGGEEGPVVGAGAELDDEAGGPATIAFRRARCESKPIKKMNTLQLGTVNGRRVYQVIQAHIGGQPKNGQR